MSIPRTKIECWQAPSFVYHRAARVLECEGPIMPKREPSRHASISFDSYVLSAFQDVSWALKGGWGVWEGEDTDNTKCTKRLPLAF